MTSLIISSDIGITAPGIVYESIIKELSKHSNIKLITLASRDELVPPVEYVSTACKKWEHPRLSKASISLFGYSLFDKEWLNRQIRLIDDEIIKRCDIIISFVSSGNYKSLELGDYISTKFHKKWIIYAVDCIPAPIGWEKNNRYYRQLKSYIHKYISKCDAFFSSNEQMLKHQLQDCSKKPQYCGVLYTPIRNTEKACFSRKCQNLIFLYTGGLYGPRKKEALLDGFKLFLEDYPDAQLYFVGIGKYHDFSEYADLINNGKIKIFDYTHNIEAFYDKASVLIDINACFDNDVFLSSKIVNYLAVHKPIISITGQNSPSRNIFKNTSSIIHCSHDKQEVYQSLHQATKEIKDIKKERERYIKLFSAEQVVSNLVTIINKLECK